MIAAALLASGAAASSEPEIADLIPISLQSGVNSVVDFAPDGRGAMITLGWRDGGNAHGYDVALVMMRDNLDGPWNVVRRNPSPGDARDRGADEITDDPHTAADGVSTFRFARGLVDGEPATLLLVATRDLAPDVSAAGPSLVSFDIYRLEHAPGMGTTPDHFRPIWRERSSGLFCNADAAIASRFDLSLSPGYGGGQKPDGCQAS